MRPIRVAFGLALLSAAASAQQYVISTFAGGATPPTPGVALNAAIGAPQALTTDAAGNVYFASPNINSVFKLSQNGVLTRIVGSSRPGYSGDGAPVATARLNSPNGVAMDDAGN